MATVSTCTVCSLLPPPHVDRSRRSSAWVARTNHITQYPKTCELALPAVGEVTSLPSWIHPASCTISVIINPANPRTKIVEMHIPYAKRSSWKDKIQFRAHVGCAGVRRAGCKRPNAACSRVASGGWVAVPHTHYGPHNRLPIFLCISGLCLLNALARGFRYAGFCLII